MGDPALPLAAGRRRLPHVHLAVLLAVLLVSVAACSRSEAPDTARRVQRAAEVVATETLGIPVRSNNYGPGTHDWPCWQRELHRFLPLLGTLHRHAPR